MSTYTIGEVAGITGFSASALRYYEGIGLVEPTTRTPAGYRLYDERTLDRLAFIGRAKQLGCSLDEICDLVELRHGERCAPVQRRFHQLVTSKLAAAHRQLADLASFTTDLETAAGQLGGNPVDGPCGEGCACLPEPSDTGDADASGCATDVPIACTLDAATLPDRRAEWHAVLGAASARTATADGGLRIEFGDEVDLAAVVQLVAAEQTCCAFFRFAITVDARGAALEVRAPAGAASIVTELFGADRSAAS